MSKVVFILGAGASFHAGAPLMNQFMRKIRDIYDDIPPKYVIKDYQLVMKGFNELNSKRAKIKMEYEDNVELLFGSFEMAKLVGSLGELTSEELSRLPEAMKRVICHTIDKSMKVVFNTNTEKVRGFDNYQLLVQLVNQIKERRRIFPAILTFNYDLALDIVFYDNKININYGIDNDYTEGINYYKLHGSLNWINDNNAIKIIPIEKILHNTKLDQDGRPAPIDTLEVLSINSNNKIIPTPFIVPPTWNKTEYHSQIGFIWEKAIKELSDVQHLIIIGYSFPQTDLFFRHLLALGMTSAILDNLLIIDLNENPLNHIKDIAGDAIKEKVVWLKHHEFNQESLIEIQKRIL
jgi:hypothetical protein